MKAAETTTIVYVKTSGEMTVRDIIAIGVPQDQVKAIDVTGWDQVSCSVTESLVAEYNEYKESQIKKIFGFEDWLAHTSRGSDYGFKWRTFKLDGILDSNPTTFEK